MADEMQLKPGWLARDVLHAKYDAASLARDKARKRFEEAQSAMWVAEADWRQAELNVQYAFVALAAVGQSTSTTER